MTESTGLRARVHVLESEGAAAHAAARIWLDALRVDGSAAVRRVLLAGGSTPARLYTVLADPGIVPPTAWPSVEGFLGDERCVPPDHPDSNYAMIRRTLIEPLGQAAPRVHRIRGEDPDPEAAARDYEAQIRKSFRASDREVPSFDLALLGLGEDGHTASLFPGHVPGEDVPRLVLVTHQPRDGSTRITVSYGLLGASRKVLFFVLGRAKAEAVRRTLDPRPGVEPTPAAYLQAAARDVTWVLDREAAALLS